MAKLPRVKIITDDDKFQRARCYIDDVEVKLITGIESVIKPGQVPQFTFETVGMPDIDMHGQVLFSFTPKTVGDAAEVIRHEFKTHPESHKALVSSIESVLKELPENGETWSFEVAEMIAKRIIGD